MTPERALEEAVRVGASSPCAKSKRGVVIFHPSIYLEWSFVAAEGCNAPPSSFRCDGSDACRKACGRVCVHAEQAALLDLLSDVSHRSFDTIRDLEMLHVKVVEGKPVPSGGPSCIECSKLILASGLAAMWLLEDRGDGAKLYRYTALEFHEMTLKNLDLPRTRSVT